MKNLLYDELARRDVSIIFKRIIFMVKYVDTRFNYKESFQDWYRSCKVNKIDKAAKYWVMVLINWKVDQLIEKLSI